MTPYEARIQYERLCPGMGYDNATVLTWLCEVDGLLQTEVLKILPQNVAYPTSVEAGTEEALFVPEPYSRLYPLYLTMMAYWWHGDFSKYANAKEMFDTAVNEWAKWVQRNDARCPECGNIIYGHITFLPYIENGTLKWRNNASLENPDPFVIKGITNIEAEPIEGGNRLTITYGQDSDTVTVVLQNGTNGTSVTDVSASPITGGNRVSITYGDSTETFDVMDGAKGDPGEKGEDGEKGETGATGASVIGTWKKQTDGNVDTYQFRMSNGPLIDGFTVTNGAKLVFSTAQPTYAQGTDTTVIRSTFTDDINVGDMVLFSNYVVGVIKTVETINVTVTMKGQAQIPSSSIPLATGTTIGGIYASPVSSTETDEVKIGAGGKLYSKHIQLASASTQGVVYLTDTVQSGAPSGLAVSPDGVINAINSAIGNVDALLGSGVIS